VSITLAGSLALRGDRPLGPYCPMQRTLDVLSTRSSILILREAYYCATRFEEFSKRAALTETTTANALRTLLRLGLFEKQPYREEGQRGRSEYVLTEKARDLMPVLLALLQWGNAHDPPPYPPALTHTACGEPVQIVAECAAGHALQLDDITVGAEGPFGTREG
jgi:DNA-binding HxlR family transcriptional regulator